MMTHPDDKKVMLSYMHGTEDGVRGLFKQGLESNAYTRGYRHGRLFAVRTERNEKERLAKTRALITSMRGGVNAEQ